ncbi:MAG: hypothetical protein Q8R92_17200 [Deltaproteobacteria bacterium]|nr:hypothetical protein [Deltaproteobacteria bacterium]
MKYNYAEMDFVKHPRGIGISGLAAGAVDVSGPGPTLARHILTKLEKLDAAIDALKKGREALLRVVGTFSSSTLAKPVQEVRDLLA